MRIVLDTNTVVSALLWRGAPHRLIEAARDRPVIFFTTAILLAELEEVLLREHLAPAIAATGETAEALAGRYRAIAMTISAAPLPSPVSRDPDDDHVLACAVAANAELLVSGDQDLRDLGNYQGIPIVSPAECMRRITA